MEITDSGDSAGETSIIQIKEKPIFQLYYVKLASTT